MEFYTQYGERRPKGSKERFLKPSETEPDNSMTIPEIIARYTRGQGYGVQTREWTLGTAPEEGEGPLQDAGLLDVLEQRPAVAAAQEPAPAAPAQQSTQAPAPPAPAPAPAPAGADAHVNNT